MKTNKQEKGLIQGVNTGGSLNATIMTMIKGVNTRGSLNATIMTMIIITSCIIIIADPAMIIAIINDIMWIMQFLNPTASADMCCLKLYSLVYDK